MMTTEQIEKQIERLNKPKLWIHTQKPHPSHRFAYSHRCVFCMSIQHRSEKCHQKQNPPLLKVEPKE